MIDVLDGIADSIWFEPLGEAGDGTEFLLRKGGSINEYHQVKRQHGAEGRWTLGALGSKAILSNFFDKLNDPTAVCVFVSSHAAYQLGELTERARSATSWEEFERHFLSADQHSTNFNQLRSYWKNCSPPETYRRLKSIRVKSIDEETLQATVECRIAPLVEGATPEGAAAILAQYVLDNVHQQLTAYDIWRHLESQNCRRREWGKDPRVLAGVENLNRRYLVPIREEAIGSNPIPRVETLTAIEKLTSSQGKRGVLLTGEAGVGKSGVMLQVAESLSGLGWPLLAFRIDRLESTLLPDKVGEQIGLPASPAQVLASVAQGRDCALIIDQLDAVSMASGRHPDFFECIREIIKQALVYPGMHLVLGCRKFDIDNDYRLRSLTGDEGVADVVAIRRLPHDTVREVVTDFGLDASRLSNTQLELLSIPLHLSLLAEVASDTSVDALDFETAKDLYDRYWERKQTLTSQHLGREPQWTRVIDTLCDYMSEKQVLSVPVVLADDFTKDAKAMASEHVLALDSGRYAFFHESFFDYAFARRFAARGMRLVPFLLGDEQHLFRRAQVRQILLHERDYDQQTYLDDLRSLLISPDIRFHLKHVAFRLLASFTRPTIEEWNFIAPFLEDPTDPRSLEVWNVLHSSPPWFNLIDSLGIIEKWLDKLDEERVNRTVMLLSSVQKQMSTRVAQLIKPYIGASEEWNDRQVLLTQWGNLSSSREFFDHFLRLIDEGVLDNARGPIAMNSDFWDLSYSLPKEHPEWAAEVVGHYLNRRLTIIVDAGLLDSPESVHYMFVSRPDSQYFTETAKGAPVKFVEQVLPFMLRAMELTAMPRDEPPWPDQLWWYRSYSGAFGANETLLDAMEIALRTLAKDDPDRFAPIAAELSQSKFETAQFLLVRAFAANGCRFADEAVEYLCQDPMRLKTGYAGDEHWATRLLLQATTPYCSEEKLARLEDVVLNYYPSWERKADRRRARGFAQLTLLDGFASSRQSARVKQRMSEWQRKFTGIKIEEPVGGFSGFVGSPIPDHAAEKMTDEQWLKAIARHDHSDVETRIVGKKFIGGAEQLAHLMENHAKKDPARFARLACVFPDGTNACYLDAVLRGVADAGLDQKTACDLLEHCHRSSHRLSGRWVCRLISKLAQAPLPDSILDMVAWYAVEDPDPEVELWRTDAGSGRMYYNGSIEAAAINSVRGSAAETIASLIFHDGSRIRKFLPVLERMVSDPSIAVRSSVAGALTSVMKHDRELAANLFLRLCDTEDDLLKTRYIERFLYYGLQTHFSELSTILDRMISSDLGEAVVAGSRLACLSSLLVEEAQGMAHYCLSGSEAHRVGAAGVFASNLHQARFSSFCEKALIGLFNDSSEKVRSEAANCFRYFKGQLLGEHVDLVNAFVKSEAFNNCHRELFRALEETTAQLPDVTCTASERFFDIVGPAAADLRTHTAAESSVVTSLLIRVYKQSNDHTVQARCLDLIDRLTQMNVYGLDDAVSQFER
jgi:hypothetical protein